MAKLFVDDVAVAVKELYSILGIDPNSVPKKHQRIFEINNDRLRKNERGVVRAPRSLGISTKFDVYSPKEDRVVTVRYSETQRYKSEHGARVIVHSPAQLFIHGRQRVIQDDVAYAYMFIHPSCQQSPFYKLENGFRYFFKDNEAIAKKDLERDEQEMRALSLIIGDRALPMDQLRQIAKGMNTPGVDQLSDSEIRHKLKLLAKENPVEFFNNSRSNQIAFNGAIQDAIDKGIITILPKNGVKRWYFVNEELCIVPSGTDEIQALKDAIVRDMHLFPQIISAIKGKSVESELNKPENQQYFNSFKSDTSDLTRQDVSSNIKSEMSDVNEELEKQKYIQELAEEEKKYKAGEIEKMHHKRIEACEKFRAEIDAYNASLVEAE